MAASSSTDHPSGTKKADPISSELSVGNSDKQVSRAFAPTDLTSSRTAQRAANKQLSNVSAFLDLCENSQKGGVLGLKPGARKKYGSKSSFKADQLLVNMELREELAKGPEEKAKRPVTKMSL
eukprot:CAMPEP_0197630204 /NCGR_PEP_ID=MMETSP1338-20131121/7768_1 /TAXON_ID=43686 ORGANISM="Pelagodinium beii, Strain RCC1491" /NCGR_SAMPLE_ID=MMETSP1338 /ASSEMBLY_ACC=CAM_ASM_000754 /LENGTH=122 /DNA_ID=CAMNT_0043201379 /DNA_START=37 /DNA_END=405 /DNA_ORIENTATION=-